MPKITVVVEKSINIQAYLACDVLLRYPFCYSNDIINLNLNLMWYWLTHNKTSKVAKTFIKAKQNNFLEIGIFSESKWNHSCFSKKVVFFCQVLESCDYLLNKSSYLKSDVCLFIKIICGIIYIWINQLQ